jgi:hypothetical protein
MPPELRTIAEARTLGASGDADERRIETSELRVGVDARAERR